MFSHLREWVVYISIHVRYPWDRWADGRLERVYFILPVLFHASVLAAPWGQRMNRLSVPSPPPNSRQTAQKQALWEKWPTRGDPPGHLSTSPLRCTVFLSRGGGSQQSFCRRKLPKLVAGDLRPGGAALTLDYTFWLLTACSQIDAGLLGGRSRSIKWHWNIHMWVHLAVHSWWAAPRRGYGEVLLGSDPCAYPPPPPATHRLMCSVYGEDMEPKSWFKFFLVVRL